MNRLWNNKFLIVNLALLRLFKKSRCVSETQGLNVCWSYSGVHEQVIKLLDMGLISLEKTASGHVKNSNAVKKYYILSHKGQKLLDLFPDQLEAGKKVLAKAWKCPHCRNLVDYELKECSYCGCHPMPSCAEAYKTP